jgi:predicted transposase YbfD/YdcC
LSAWVREDGISLGQIAVDEKENEIVAIPKLLDVVDITGGLVSY